MTYNQCWLGIVGGWGADRDELMRYLGMGLAILAVLGSSTPAMAQSQAVLGGAADENTEAACLVIGGIWRGNPAEIKAIESIPVPSSYKAGYATAGPECEVPYPAANLLGWHGRFGTEQSSLAAVAYLRERERAYLKQARRAAAIVKSERARIAKLPVEKQQERSAREDLGNATSEMGSALLEMAVMGNDIMFVAERFSSARLRDHAARLILTYDSFGQELPLPTEVAEKAVIEGGKCTPECQFARRLKANDRKAAIDTLRLRVALFDAQTSKANVNAFVKLVIQSDRPEYQNLDQYVYHGYGFCDLPKNAPEAVVKICREDFNFQHRALDHAYYNAMARELTGDFAVPRSDSFEYFFAREQAHGGSSDHARGAGDDRGVTLQRTQALARWEQARSGKRTNGRPDIHGMNDGLALLMKATDKISPLDDPVLFRKMATKALQWDAEMAALDSEKYAGLIGRLKPELDYYRSVLPQLDAIVAGEHKAINIRKTP